MSQNVADSLNITKSSNNINNKLQPHQHQGETPIEASHIPLARSKCEYHHQQQQQQQQEQKFCKQHQKASMPSVVDHMPYCRHHHNHSHNHHLHYRNQQLNLHQLHHDHHQHYEDDQWQQQQSLEYQSLEEYQSLDYQRQAQTQTQHHYCHHHLYQRENDFKRLTTVVGQVQCQQENYQPKNDQIRCHPPESHEHQHPQKKKLKNFALHHHRSSPCLDAAVLTATSTAVPVASVSSASFTSLNASAATATFGSSSCSSLNRSQIKLSTDDANRRRTSWYVHSFDNLDVATDKYDSSSSLLTSAYSSVKYNTYHHNRRSGATERKVVKSLKYLCACTGATLRNLSKRTKNLHAKNYLNSKVKKPDEELLCRERPTWRYWGEEHEKDAIFTVYLKKVRYHRPTPSANNDSDDEISHLEWETVRVRFVKAATLARLVEALATDDGELESTFINVFLSTYRTFSTPKEVLNLLIKRYDTLHEKSVQETDDANNSADYGNDSPQQSSSYDSAVSINEQHKKALVSAMHVWLDGFPEDWNEENLRVLLAFAAKRLPRSELHLKVLDRLERILRKQLYFENVQPWLIVSTGGTATGAGSIPSAHYGAAIDLSDQFAGICLAPSFRTPTHFLHAFSFPHVPVRHFAEQLTRMDSDLFKRLIPHQCLGATWGRRDKSGSETVVATINQFNAVSLRVISSILIEPKLRPQERALNIATWIDIAQELRLLKNFSSLKAIISGLQSASIERLSKIWAVLPKEKMEIFLELARIFSEDNNASAQREVLMREGTAKFADTVGEHDRHLQKIIQKQSTLTSHGTIPYLGTFLTDLVMMQAAMPDTIGEQELINFDKKRREFEVLAQIKLLQGAANTYNLREDPNFDRWFASMLVLDEREAHNLSLQLEPPTAAPRKSTTSTNTSLTTMASTGSSNSACGGDRNGGGGSSSGHRKTDSIASNSSSGAGSQFYYELNNTYGGGNGSHYSNSSRHNSLDRDAQLPTANALIMSASSSVSNLSMDSNNSGTTKNHHHSGKMTHSHSANGVRDRVTANNSQNISLTNGSSSSASGPCINAQLVQSPGAISSAPDFYIIRVTYETENIELDGIILYKSIMLGNNERTTQVIRNAMMKLGLEGDPDGFTLAQVLPDKELVMPKSANVFYAVNTNYNLNFILRPKKKESSGGS